MAKAPIDPFRVVFQSDSRMNKDNDFIASDNEPFHLATSLSLTKKQSGRRRRDALLHRGAGGCRRRNGDEFLHLVLRNRHLQEREGPDLETRAYAVDPDRARVGTTIPGTPPISHIL